MKVAANGDRDKMGEGITIDLSGGPRIGGRISFGAEGYREPATDQATGISVSVDVLCIMIIGNGAS